MKCVFTVITDMIDIKCFGLTIFCIIPLAIMAMGENTSPGKISALLAVKRGNCSCGGFASESPEAGEAPAVAQSPLVVTCDAAGGDTCRNLCVALGQATRAKGPEILCMRIGNATELKLAGFYQVCDEPWTYSGLKSEEPLCCNNFEVMPCPSISTTVTVTSIGNTQ